MKGFTVVAAVHFPSMGIGHKGKLPWKISEDMKFFSEITSTTKNREKCNAVLMGRKTYDSLPKRYKPLPNRKNIVLTSNKESLEDNEGVHYFSDFNEALNQLLCDDSIENIFVIGGAIVYHQALKHPLCQKLLITEIKGDLTEIDFDSFFPSIYAHEFNLTRKTSRRSENHLSYCFCEYNRCEDYENDSSLALIELPTFLNYDNFEERQYLNAISDILNNGIRRGDRTGTGTISKFGLQMRFNLRNRVFPLLTTKRVFWRGVVEELLWFIRGSTNANELREKGIHIWDGNASREFLDKRGLHHREEGDLGPVYGFQWRHFGAKYQDMHASYEGQGVDQLKECIHQIKRNRDVRGILMSAWNPTDLSLMALPPCHILCQFYVADGYLSCQMYQRSADMGLGVPFNIASYSLLTYLVAHVCGLQPGDFVHTIGDAHVYCNHVEALREQIKRQPKPFPQLTITTENKDIDGIGINDLLLENYNPHAPIKMEMAV